MPDHKVICHLLLSAIISCYPVSVRYLCVYCLLRIDEKYSLCVIYTFFTELLGLVYSFYVYFMGRVGAPLTVVHPSQNSGRAAFPHPALCETNRSHYHSYILTYTRGLTSG